MYKPLVSLLMAAYNNAGYVKWAVDSVKAQTYDNWELVIVDDGSTDGTRELVAALATDPRIKVSFNGRNLGVNQTMHKLSSLATGELYTHLDSDDMLDTHAIESMVKVFAQHPEVMLVYSDYAQVSRLSTLDNLEIELYNANPKFDPAKLYQHGWRPFGMYRSAVKAEGIDYNEALFSVSGCVDGDLFMQIAERFPVLHYPRVLYFYRNHGVHTSAKKLPCEICPANPNCNYIRVWAKSAGVDQRTLQSLKKD